MAATVNASIVEHFRTLADPCIERTKKHNLLDILIIAVCTLLTGREGFQDIGVARFRPAWRKCMVMTIRPTSTIGFIGL